MCQIRKVVNQKLLPLADAPAACCAPNGAIANGDAAGVSTAGPCCAPLACEPVSAGRAGELAPLFKAVADPMRLRLLSLIACHEGGEACVCDLLGEFDVTAPSVSYHLKILREAGLISSERRGTWVYYRVNPNVMARMSAVLVPPLPVS
jgi:ArsR family transcriptional regulator